MSTSTPSEETPRPLPWIVRFIDDDAESDIEGLRKQDRKIWLEAVSLMRTLASEPYIGRPCRPPLIGARKRSFWNPDYRLAWRPDPKSGQVHILGAGKKGRDARFWPALEDRWQRYEAKTEEERRPRE